MVCLLKLLGRVWILTMTSLLSMPLFAQDGTATSYIVLKPNTEVYWSGDEIAFTTGAQPTTVEFLKRDAETSKIAFRTGPARGCVANLSYDLALTAWVHSKDVAWVATEDFEQTFDNGTAARIRRGTPLRPGPSSSEWVLDFVVPVPLNNVPFAKVYQEDRPTKILGLPQHIARSITVGSVIVSTAEVGLLDDKTIATPCLELDAKVGDAQPRPDSEPGQNQTFEHFVQRGTSLMSEGGRDAGTVNAKLYVSPEPQRPECFAVREETFKPFTLCTERSNIKTVSKVPKIVIGKPQVGPSLDKDVIRRVIRTRLKQVKACYNEALKHDGTLKGKLVVKFAIRNDGTIVSLRALEDTIGGDSVASCVLDELSTLKFPKPKGGGMILVSYPFVFKPSP